MEGITTLKADTTLDKFNPKNQLSKKLPPYLQTMNEIEKDKNIKLIQSMNKKITFLKNPRFLPPKLNKKLGTLAAKSSFRLNPQAVLFTDYEEGAVYKIPFAITNVSGVLKRIQILGPSTEFFSLGEVTYPSSETGMVASGMSVTVTVHFHAIKVAELDDQLIVKSDEGTLEVPVRARLEPPQLTLEEVLEAGTAWVGDRTDMTFRCRNLGGSAGFKFFHEFEEYDAPLGEEVLISGPFTIFPLQFYLMKGQSIDIYVCFQPMEEGLIENKVILACDNQTSQFFYLRGEGAVLDLSVDQIDNKTLDFESNPLKALWFPSTHPNSSATRTLKIQNKSALPVTYHWSQYTDSEENITLEKQNTHYEATPSTGTMQAKSVNEFQVTFTPTSARPFPEFLDLVVEEVPIHSIKNVPENLKHIFNVENAVPDPFLGSNGQHLPIPQLQFELQGRGNLCEVEFSPPFYIFSENLLPSCPYTAKVALKNNSDGVVNFRIRQIPEKSSPGLYAKLSPIQGYIIGKGSSEVEIEWVCESLGEKLGVFMCCVENGPPVYFQVRGTVQGPSVSIPETMCDFGLVRAGTKQTLTFKVQNNTPVANKIALGLSDQELSFSGQNVSNDPKISIFPSCCELAAYGTKEIQVSLQSAQIEVIEKTIKVGVLNGYNCFISLYANVQKPLVYLSEYEFDMGQLAVGIESKTKTFKIVNYGNLSAEFEWEAPEDQNQLLINPSSGSIPPKSYLKAEFSIKPQIGGEMKDVWVCNVQGMERPIGFRAKGNVKGLEISYLLSDPLAESGSMLPPSMYNMTDRQSFLSSMALKPDSESKLEVLDFGNCGIGTPKSLTFVIKNSSGLSTDFEIAFEKFNPSIFEDEYRAKLKSKQPNYSQLEEASPKKITFAANTKLQTSEKKKPSRNKLPPLLTNAHEEKNKFSTKEGATFTATKKLERSSKFYLGNNQGLAIVADPRIGQVQPYSEVTVTVTLYNDVCGRFEDVMVSKVKGLAPHRIPVKARVKGSPLILAPNQLGINYNLDPPVLSLGTVPSGGNFATRKLKLFNSGPKPISVDWKVFNYKDLASRSDDIFKISLNPIKPSKSEIEKPDFFDVKFAANEIQETPCNFSISPKEAVIEGRQNFVFSISFKSEEENQHDAVVIANPKLEEDEESAPLSKMGVYLQAKTLKPWLHVDKVPREDNFYYVSFDCYAVGGPVPKKDLILRNLTPSNLSFNVSIEEGPFMITQVKTSDLSNLDEYEGSEVADLVERKNLKRTSSNLPISQQKHTLNPEDFANLGLKFVKPNPSDYETWPDVPRSFMKGKLLVAFSNGATQIIKLEGRLYRPKLTLQSPISDEFNKLEEQDFGTINIKSKKKLTLHLCNDSPVEGKWRLTYAKYPFKASIGHRTMTRKEKEDQTIVDDPSVFQFSVSEGSLQGPTVPVKHIPTASALPAPVKPTHTPPLPIHVLFRPKLPKLYKSMYRIIVDQGPDIEVVLKGQGSLLEEHDH